MKTFLKGQRGLALLVGVGLFLYLGFDLFASRWIGIGRDAFPVFDDPNMMTAAQAEETGLIFSRDAVIGVAHGGEAKAYPIRVMGVHELGNDTIGGVPIAVSW